jgi:tRNA-specific 2-thiouridylase
LEIKAHNTKEITGDNKPVVCVGMSGGVDSSVAAYLLKEQGYKVIGLFMHNWNETSENGVCTAEDDYADVRRVCSVLDIPYYTVDYSKEYQDRVFKLFVEEYKSGRTPNPDVLCNREIKFKELKAAAVKLGAQFLATGHYCGIKNENGTAYLMRSFDENKDQTYFLNQVTQEQLQGVLFPLEGIEKPKVRAIAEKIGLNNAKKKDSTGICFIGERNFRKFLAEYLPMKKGLIKDLAGNVLGEHNGVYYYTIGQRKGFELGGVKGYSENPWYIVKKDAVTNTLYVNSGECDELYSKIIKTSGFNFISRNIEKGETLLLRTRHREALIECKIESVEGDSVTILPKTPVRAVTPGQYAVLYDNRITLGGGVIL